MTPRRVVTARRLPTPSGGFEVGRGGLIEAGHDHQQTRGRVTRAVTIGALTGLGNGMGNRLEEPACRYRMARQWFEDGLGLVVWTTGVSGVRIASEQSKSACSDSSGYSRDVRHALHKHSNKRMRNSFACWLQAYDLFQHWKQ
jgi:hypothetical protein